MKSKISNLITLAQEGKAVEFEKELKDILTQAKESKLEKFGSRFKREFLNTEDFDFRLLEDIVEKKSAKVLKFEDGSVARVDYVCANALINIRECLNSDNKKLLEEAVGKDKTKFFEMVNFAISNT